MMIIKIMMILYGGGGNDLQFSDSVCDDINGSDDINGNDDLMEWVNKD